MEHQIVDMTNAEYMAYALKKNGVKDIFGLSNPSNIMMACMDHGIRQVCYRQENAGCYMAQGYGMLSGRVPVVTAQNGPAAALLVPGLAECLTSSHPVVALVQQVSLGNYHKNAFQELDHEKLFAGCTKWVSTIYSADRIADYVDLAFTQAASGRPGPVVLLCPFDIFSDKKKYPRKLLRTIDLGRYPLDRVQPPQDRLAEAAAMIAAADHPIIVAGGGVILSSAAAALRDLQERYSLPVLTTTMGKGSVDELHPLSIGVSGYISGKRGMAHFLRQEVAMADLLVFVGTRTNQNGTDSWTLFPENATYIHIDMDGTEIGRNYESFRLLGDARSTLEALATAMGEQDLSKRIAARPAIESRIAEARARHDKEAADVTDSMSRPIRIEHFVKLLDKHLDDDHIVVADASFSSIWLANYITATAGRRFVFPRGLAGLGWGLPLAMGAKVASPRRKVFCMAGDGGFAYVWGELEALKRDGMDVVCAVINNEMMGYQYWREEANFNGRHTNACELGPVDHTMVARACGVKGIRLEDPEQIDAVLEEAFASDGSVIIDIIADPDSIPPVSVLEKVDGKHYHPVFLV